MRTIVPLCLAWLAFTACGQPVDTHITDQRFPPSCEVVWPADDGQLLFGADLEIAVTISDSDTPPDELSFRAVSDLDGILPGTATIDDIGATLDVDGGLLREGYHTLTVTVSDESAVDECVTHFHVVPNSDPSVNFASPDPDDTYLSSENVWVDISAFDADETDQRVLSLEWNGVAADQPTAPEHPDSDGLASWPLPRLSAGDYTIGVRVIDPVGGTRTQVVAFTVVPTDGDGDGWISAGDGGTDCDDDAFAVHPAQPELCNGIDDNCDGVIDGEDATDAVGWYPDADGDGFGNEGLGVVQCVGPAGYIATGGDCDDTDDDIHPAADETCDGVDENCNGTVDDAPIDGDAYYADLDGDTFGDPGGSTTACGLTVGVSTDGTDCDDSDPAVSPVATELCGNGVDDDCDGGVDEACVIEHCGPITVAELWTNDWEHHITCTVSVESTLSIEPGASVVFVDNTARLDVGSAAPGRLLALGTGTDPITFRPQSDFGGSIRLGASDTGSVLENVEFSGSSAARAAIENHSVAAEIVDSVIRDGTGDGLHNEAGSVLTVRNLLLERMEGNGITGAGRIAELADTTITGNLGFPLQIDVADLGNVVNADLSGNWNNHVLVSGSALTVDALWRNLGAPYRFEGHVRVGSLDEPTLTIEPGVTLTFPVNAEMHVGSNLPGRLVIQAAADPVELRGVPTREFPDGWDGLHFGPYDLGSDVEGLTVRHAQHGIHATGSDIFVTPALSLSEVRVEETADAAILLGANAAMSLLGADIADNDGDGLYAEGELLALSDLVLERNGGRALGVAPDHVLDALAATTFVDNADERVHVLAWERDLTRSALWPRRDEPYQIGGVLHVDDPSAPTLTLADGVVVQFRTLAGIAVVRGSLDVAPGPEGVLFTSARTSPAPGDWGSLRIGVNGAVGASALDGLTIEYAGGGRPGSLEVSNDGAVFRNVTVRDGGSAGFHLSATATEAVVEDSVIRDHADEGISGQTRGWARRFHNNVITGNAMPMLVESPLNIEALDHSNLISGNAVDLLEVVAQSCYCDVPFDTTVRNFGMPWRIGGVIWMDHSSRPVLSIEPGVRMEFGPAGGLYFGEWSTYGTLEALGTAAEPIVLTSVSPTPAPGDWRGLSFSRDSEGTVQHTTIEYAGGAPLGASLSFAYHSSVQWSNVTVRHSAGYGAQAAHTTVDPDVSGITFSDIELADVSW